MSLNIHIRGIDKQLMMHLKREAAKNDVSMNALILSLLKKSFGLSKERYQPTYHDLDKLAGTWSEKEAEEFLKNISDFKQIDEDLWK